MANIQVLGKLGKNVEIKTVGQSTVAEFSLAETVGFGEKKQTIWYDCSLWGNQAKSSLIDYLNKGREVFICGEMTTFTTNDGKTYLKIHVNQLKLTSGTKDSQQPQQQTTQPTYKKTEVKQDLDDDLPF